MTPLDCFPLRELESFSTTIGANMYSYYNGNPRGKNVGDCTVRAISKATGMDWGATYLALAIEGYLDGDMPSANACWGRYLRSIGYRRYIVPDTCPDCYTVGQFAEDHPVGTYILALSGHVVCVQNGTIWDSWDSSNENVLYYWERTDKA